MNKQTPPQAHTVCVYDFYHTTPNIRSHEMYFLSSAVQQSEALKIICHSSAIDVGVQARIQTHFKL